MHLVSLCVVLFRYAAGASWVELCKYPYSQLYDILSTREVTLADEGKWTSNTSSQNTRRPPCTCLLGCNVHRQNVTWWRHQMETFSALLALCSGNSPIAGEFPAQRPVTRSVDVFFDLCLNKRLSKQSKAWWFEAPSCSLWRQCNKTQEREKTMDCKNQSRGNSNQASVRIEITSNTYITALIHQYEAYEINVRIPYIFLFCEKNLA